MILVRYRFFGKDVSGTGANVWQASLFVRLFGQSVLLKHIFARWKLIPAKTLLVRNPLRQIYGMNRLDHGNSPTNVWPTKTCTIVDTFNAARFAEWVAT